MRLYYFSGENGVTNFGDELNHLIWRHFLPGLLDDDASAQFVGIGTLLNDRLPPSPRTVIFGSGVGYYGTPRVDESWRIYCVRGPRSAEALGLAGDMAVTDPAALIARLPPRDRAAHRRVPYAFMPHWQSEPAGWQAVCEMAGVAFIDPRWPTDRVLDALACTDLLVAEAMHGCIVADALRIPWVAVRTSHRIKSLKWEDWCGSLGLEYRPAALPPVWPAVPGLVRRARRWARLTLIAHRLRAVARQASPSLSPPDVLERRITQLEERLESVRREETFRAPRMSG